jgi:hypothetical protein
MRLLPATITIKLLQQQLQSATRKWLHRPLAKRRIVMDATVEKVAQPLVAPRATLTTTTAQQVASTLVVKFHQPLQPQQAVKPGPLVCSWRTSPSTPLVAWWNIPSSGLWLRNKQVLMTLRTVDNKIKSPVFTAGAFYFCLVKNIVAELWGKFR